MCVASTVERRAPHCCLFWYRLSILHFSDYYILCAQDRSPLYLSSHACLPSRPLRCSWVCHGVRLEHSPLRPSAAPQPSPGRAIQSEGRERRCCSHAARLPVSHASPPPKYITVGGERASASAAASAAATIRVLHTLVVEAAASDLAVGEAARRLRGDDALHLGDGVHDALL